MTDPQKGLFNNSSQTSSQNHPPIDPDHPQGKRPLISINLSGKGVLIVGFVIWMLLESFAPDILKPSSYLVQRVINVENKKTKGTQQVLAEAKALEEAERNRVLNAYAEEQNMLVQSLTAQIERVKTCEMQKIQLMNDNRAQCLNDGVSTLTDCDYFQEAINEQACPEMPKLTAQTQKLLDQYNQ